LSNSNIKGSNRSLQKIKDSKKDSMMSKYVNDGVSDHRGELETPNILKTNKDIKESEQAPTPEMNIKPKYTHEYK
jgi:hypothetical protein